MRRKLDSGVCTNVQFECPKTEVPGSVVHEGARGNAFERKRKKKKKQGRNVNFYFHV